MMNRNTGKGISLRGAGSLETECAPAQEIGLNWLCAYACVFVCVYLLCVWALGVAPTDCLCLLRLSGCGRSSCTSRTDRHHGELQEQ